ncbi:3',5'-cyclic-nucleotide phosphodiesterase [Saxophila tyrrhenica]|uniref:Phosphodiesterase n=1 Tax=Saxophila tyrrhenica TaxID=1690608 RepID=A0AAV9PEM8_9PEZI|nr:3',5'-cyclic-nucleotide phosphodiesterase [Saxophila tyrrhenica]
MEEHAHESCNIVYFCASGKEDVYELYHKRSPPDVPPEGDEGAETLQQAYHNVRALLDEDQGGFDEVFLCSSIKQCSERLEIYANSSPTVVLIELHSSPSAQDESNLTLDKQSSSYALLTTLGTDIQGARYQRPVLPFILVISGRPPHGDGTLESSLTADLLSAGAKDVIQSPLQHEDINHLIGHLKEKVRAPVRLIASQMAHNLVDSIHDCSEPRIAEHRPDLNLPQERKTAVEETVGKWHFPASDFNMDELTYAAMFMLEHLLRAPELEFYALPRDKLMSFLLATRRQYKHEREVYYHNWRHAVDVTQSMYCFLLDVRLCTPQNSDEGPQKELNALERMVTHLDGLILLVSGIGHDVGHPGVNNAFLVAANHPLAQTYNDKSVLENYHCAAYSQLLRRHWPALHNITGFRSTMISTILATDMQRHFDYMKSLNELKSKTESADADVESWNDKDKEHTRELIMALLMKAADISNVARPFDVSSSWAKILMNEFARQGELENELEIPTCLFGGPPDTEDILAAAQSQKGFMSLFGYPLFQGIADILPCISCAVKEIQKNQEIWDKKIEEEKERRKPRGNEGHLTFSSVTNKEVEEANSHHKSDPSAVPNSVPQSPLKDLSRAATPNTDTSPSKHGAQGLRQQLVHGIAPEDDHKRASAPFLGANGPPLSPQGGASRRSSKDVALDQMQQLTAFAHQSLSPTPSSRRGSADAGLQIQQSYPSSRRGSKDESLTTILVTKGGTPNRRSSPSLPSSKTTSPNKQLAKRNSIQQTQKQAARASVPSARSHAASTGTATTTQPSLSTDASTQPSSEEGDRDPKPLSHHASIPSTEDPFMVPGTWPNNLDGQHRASPPAGELPNTPPTPPSMAMSRTTSPRDFLRQSPSADTDASRGTQRKVDGKGVRESRSRSRLRGLKFWKRRKGGSEGEGKVEVDGASP